MGGDISYSSVSRSTLSAASIAFCARYCISFCASTCPCLAAIRYLSCPRHVVCVREWGANGFKRFKHLGAGFAGSNRPPIFAIKSWPTHKRVVAYRIVLRHHLLQRRLAGRYRTKPPGSNTSIAHPMVRWRTEKSNSSVARRAGTHAPIHCLCMVFGNALPVLV